MKLTRERLSELYEQGQAALIEEVLQSQAALETRVEGLLKRVSALEARLNQDSHNSHQPPSRDGYRRPPPKSQRKPSGRRSGGQPGHPGTTLKMVAEPHHVVEHWPTRCAECGAGLGQTQASGHAKRQVHDLPPLQVEVTEHRAMQVGCGQCGTLTQASFPDGVQPGAQYGSGIVSLAVYLQAYQLLPLERAAELLRDVAGCEMSEGTLVHLLAGCAQRVAPIEVQIKTALSEAAVTHYDETGMRVANRLGWFHVVSTDQLTFLAVDERRGTTAHAHIGLLPGFTGVAVHDAYASYFTWAGEHALCNAHTLRDLTAVADTTRQRWPTKLKALLLQMKTAVAEAVERGQSALSPPALAELEAQYDRHVRRALKANPRPPRPPGRRGNAPRAGFACNLAERLRDHKVSVLRFLHDFRVPFDNNQAERDLRMLKVKQKVSGCFRSVEGARVFARVRGYLATVRKQGYAALAALRALFDGHPVALNLG
ncbi:MAG: IS66 family transposase [Chloroflexi bacterium]|nr:IS66 family transposase [Chloroflexota bacterium]